ncbi:MAG: NAD-dependent succinate-semialdehyde dehydrogenase [Thermoleophilia bacterium]|nr:NAD-dependent succinate-semialdehyde dehydrogenase [Thermoleophilia bacterium]
MATKTSSIASINPYTGKVEREFQPHSNEQVDAAVRDAHAAFERWCARPVAERAKVVARAGELMLERIDELAELATLEMGKLLREAKQEVQLAASILTYYGTKGEELLADRAIPQETGSALMTFEPLGVILAVEPWNFPYYQAVRPVAPALVAGNVVLLKHASSNPQCAMALERLFADAGAPAHVFTNLLVPGKEVSRIIEDPRVRGVALTGSEPAGASVAETAGKFLKHSVLELGGSDPFIVLDDADLEVAIATAVAGRITNTGQICTSPKRMIVVGDRYDAFVQGVVKGMEALVPGDPRSDATTIGPLSSEAAAKGLEEQVEKAVTGGAKLLTGGHRMERDGWFFEPTVMVDIDEDNYAYSEELFGPVAMVYRAATEDEAVRIANDVRFGLGATILTGDTDRGEALARRIDSGMVWINQPTGSQPELPFGGVKSSGYGRELGADGILEFTNHKLIRTMPAQGGSRESIVG